MIGSPECLYPWIPWGEEAQSEQSDSGTTSAENPLELEETHIPSLCQEP